MKIETLLADPQILLLRDFISRDEAACLLRQAENHFVSSKVTCSKAEGCVSDYRTSSTAYLPPTVVGGTIARRGMGFAKLGFAEELQIVRYFPGQQFKAHLDAFDPKTFEGRKELAGFGGRQRDATLLIYLNKPISGGATRFTHLKLDIEPEPGAALFWRNIDQSGRIDQRTMHAGLPVQSGVKFAINLWLRGEKALAGFPQAMLSREQLTGRRSFSFVALGASETQLKTLGEFKPSLEADAKQFNMPVERQPYTGTPNTLQKMASYIREGSISPAMTQFAEMVIKNDGIASSVHLSNIDAAQILLTYVKKNVRYRPDPDNMEKVQSPFITLCVPGAQMCIPVEDCFPEGTLLLKDDFTYVPVEQIKVGDRIWGKDKWTKVESKKAKGKLSVDAVEMNNGSTVYLTPDHKIYVGKCVHNRTDCQNCWGPDRSISYDRIKVSDLLEGMALMQPDKIDFGSESPDSDRMYVEALALADGWVRDNLKCFYVAGRDGMRKEKQKHEVKAICDKLGIETRWHRRYIVIYDSVWAARISSLGERARFKHLESINLTETSAEAALRGLMADSTPSSVQNKDGARTYSTTSPIMMLQVRTLHRMFGKSTSVKMLTPEQHGGAGKFPLWRVANRSQKIKREKALAVKAIERNVKKIFCWDIQTEDHYVYLPEHDVTVSNCDGLTVALGSLMGAYGIPVRIMKQTFGSDAEEEHVLIVFKTDDGRWLPADPSAPLDKGVGWMASDSSHLIVDPLDPQNTGTPASDFVAVGGRPKHFELTLKGVGRLPAKRMLLGTVRDDVVAVQTRLEDLALATALAYEACSKAHPGVLNDAAWTSLSQRILTYVSADPDSILVIDGQALATELYTWGDQLQAAGCTRPIPAPLPKDAVPPPTPGTDTSWIYWVAGSVIVVAGVFGLKEVVELVKVSGDLVRPPALERLARRVA